MSGSHVELEAREVKFFSELDETVFFEWIKRLSFVKKCVGKGRSLLLTVNSDEVDEFALRELLSLFRRYGIDSRQLANFNKPFFEQWFKDPNAYWFNSVFD